MSFIERIKIVFDVDNANATKGFRTLKADVAAADGALAKAKVGATGLGQQLQQHAAPALMAMGTAAVAFAAKSVTSFANTAVEVGKFADATGLSAEQASRLREVAHDTGVSVETLASAVRKNNAAAESGALAEYGIEVAKLADGTTDVNQTFINTVSSLGRMTDATQREAAAKKLLGKSWAELSELVANGGDEMVAALAAVSEEQIFTDEQIAKGREVRDAFDSVNDSIAKVTKALGEDLAPAAADSANALATTIDAADKLNLLDMVGATLTAGLSGVVGVAGEAADAFDALTPEVLGFTSILPETSTEVDTLGMSLDELQSTFKNNAAMAEYYAARVKAAKEPTDDLGDAIDGAGDAADDAATFIEQWASEMDAAKDAAETLLQMAEDLRSELINNADAGRDAERAMDDYQQALEDLAAVEKDKEASAEELSDAQRNTADSAIAAAKAFAVAEGDAIDSAAGTDRLKLSLGYLASTLAPGSALRVQLEQYLSELDGAEGERKAKITVDTVGAQAAVRALIALINLAITAANQAKASAAAAASSPFGSWGRSGNRAAQTAAQMTAGGTSSASAPGVVSAPSIGSEAWLKLIEEFQASGESGSFEQYLTNWVTAQNDAGDELYRRQHELGEVSDADWRAYLARKLASAEKYSDEYMSLVAEIGQIDAQAAATAEAQQDAADAQAEANAAAEAAALQAAADDEARIMEAKFNLGRIDSDTYLAFLATKQAATVKWSAEWVALEEEQRRINQQIRADEKAAQDKKDAEDKARAEAEAARIKAQADAEFERLENQWELGKVDTATYVAALEEKLKNERKFSDEWMAIRQAIRDAKKQDADEAHAAAVAANQDTQTALELAYAEAEAAQDLLEATVALSDAKSTYSAVISDPDAKPEQIEAAAKAYAGSIYEHLVARATARGIKDHTKRWAKFMRRRLLVIMGKVDAAISMQLGIYLAGIPDLSVVDEDDSSADEGATAGASAGTTQGASAGTAPPSGAAAGGGQPTRDRATNITINAGLGTDGVALGRAVVDALRQYQGVAGPLPITVQ